MKVPIFRIVILTWIVFGGIQSVCTLSALGQSVTNPQSTAVKLTLDQPARANSAIAQNASFASNVAKSLNNSATKEYSLSNGLKVIFIQDKAFPSVSCFTWYKVGSRDDPPGMTGLTHLVEHLLFQNIGAFNGNQWANSVVRSGGEFNGFTSEDFTAFYSNLPTYQLELALRGEAARMRSAHFTKADVAKEVERLVKEEKAEEQDPMHLLNREVHALAYEKHPYRNPPGGWRHELERLTVNEAKAYYDKYFYPNNATLVLVGNFDEQQGSVLVEKYFGAMPKSDTIPANVYAQERPQLAERQIRLKAHSGKESLILAYKVPGISEADAPVISVIEQFINNQLHGPLQAELIDSGLCSFAQAAFEQKRDSGLLVIKCSEISPNGSDRVLQILDSCLNQLRTKALPDIETSRLLQQTEFNFYCESDGPYRSAFQTGFFATLAKSENARLWPKKIRQIKAADILNGARMYLSEGNRVLGHVEIANISQSNEKQKIDCSFTDDSFALLSRPHSALEKTLFDEHYRLAAYGMDLGKPYPLLSQSSTGIQSSIVSPVRVNSDHVDTDGSLPKYKVLHNGLRISVIESHLNPLVQIYGAVKAGSAYEHPDERGMSKLLAQIFDKGCITASKQHLVAAQSDLGMPLDTVLKFDANQESILFHTKCLSEDFPKQTKNMFSCLMEPCLQADFEASKTDLAIALRRSEKSAESRIDRVLLRSLVASNSVYFPLHPEEEISAISNFKLNDLVDFYHEHCIPANTTIVVCGDVRADEVFDAFEKCSQGWILNAQTYANVAPEKNYRAPELILSNRAAYKSSLIMPVSSPAQIIFGKMISVPNVKQTENYWAALLIADCALTGHPIFCRVSEQFNLKPELLDSTADSVFNTKIFKLENKLLWSLDIHLLPKASSSAVVSTVQSLLSQFAKCGLRQEEVIEAKKYLTGSIPVKECSNLEELTRYTLRGVYELNEITPIIAMQKTINSLKYDDINEFIAKTFKPESASLVVAGPRELIRQIRPLQQVEASEVNSD